MTFSRKLMTFVVAGALTATSVLPLSSAAYAGPVRGAHDGGHVIQVKGNGHKFGKNDRGPNRKFARKAHRKNFRRGNGRVNTRHNRGRDHGQYQKRNGISGPAALAIGLGIATLAIIAAGSKKKH